MPNTPDNIQLLEKSSFLLMEAAVVERVRRHDATLLHPLLHATPLIYDAKGRELLARVYEEYIEVAVEAGVPLVLSAPTWRADHRRVAESGLQMTINEDAVAFMQSLRAAHPECRIVINALIGPCNDCYQPDQALDADRSEAFHTWQAQRLAAAGVDFLLAETLPSLEESEGLARAMAKTGRPYVLSFVLSDDGNLLDGTTPSEAIRRIDQAQADVRPLGYMFNCCYPTFFEHGAFEGALAPRLFGFQANGAGIDPRRLDQAETLLSEPAEHWARDMWRFHEKTSARVLGGCCGTDARYLRALVKARRQAMDQRELQ